MPTLTPNAVDEIELSPEILALLHPQQGPGETETESLTEKMQSMSSLLKDDRKRCIDGRRLSGIEDVWRKCEDNYAAIDEVTGQQAAVVRPRFSKPPDLEGPLRRNDQPASSSRSTAFERLTARYVNAATAKICSILFTSGAKPFSIKETPDPTLVQQKEDLTPVTLETGQPALRDPKPADTAPVNPSDPLTPPPPDPNNPPSTQPGVPILQKDLAQEKIDQANKAAKGAETIIEDWMLEAKWVQQMRKVMHQAPKLGAGVLKGPFPELRKAKAVTVDKEAKTVSLEMVEELKPGFKAISPWDFFPDPDCGEDIHAGASVWERDYLSEKGLKDLKGIPGYFTRDIDQVIQEGPGKRELAASDKDQPIKDTRFEIWYGHRWMSQEDVKLINQYTGLPSDHAARLPEEETALSVVVTMVNDCLIRCTMNGLEKTGHFPYRVIPWTPRAGHWCGVGAAEQLFMPQEMVNAATRAMVNNAGVSCGSQIVMMRGMVEPAVKDDFVIDGDKLWFLKPDAMIDDVRKVFGTFTIPNITPQILEIIMHAYRVAETSCNIPLITEGQSGETTPETLGQTELQNNNANQLLREVAANVDECMTEPNVDDLYEWLLLDPDVPNDKKGDFQIDAQGASSIMERAIQAQFLAQQGGIVVNPAFGVNPKKWYGEVLKSQHLNPKTIQYTEEEQQRMASAPPPKAPAVEAAIIKSQTDLQLGKMNVDRDTAFVSVEKDKNTLDHELRMQELQQHERIETLKYANQHQISIEQVKAQLAETTMKLSVQKELSAKSDAVDLHKHSTPQAEIPPTEPAGKAPVGESFQK
jgi:hypothetical protein